MIELFEQNERTTGRQSSKGNQLKWKNNGIWYKADYTGYEGLAEYVASHLLKLSSLSDNEYVLYDTERIKYKSNIYNGVKSADFLTGDWQIITLERLFKNKYGRSLTEELWHIPDVEERVLFLSNQVKNITGLTKFDKYINKLMTIDALFLNEDRHMHNIAVLMNSQNEFNYCRIFDNGACFLSDTTMDYPIGADVYKLMSESRSKTFSRDYDEQLDVSEKLAGINIRFTFTKKDVNNLLDSCDQYEVAIRERVEKIIYTQMDKYAYLFRN